RVAPARGQGDRGRDPPDARHGAGVVVNGRGGSTDPGPAEAAAAARCPEQLELVELHDPGRARLDRDAERPGRPGGHGPVQDEEDVAGGEGRPAPPGPPPPPRGGGKPRRAPPPPPPPRNPPRPTRPAPARRRRPA